MELAEVIGLVVLVAIALAIVLIAVRRAWLSRAGGFDVSWRTRLTAGDRGWILGQGKYRGADLRLYRSLSPLPIASRSLGRGSLVIGEVRDAVGTEPDLLPVGAVIVRCTDRGVPLELALSGDVLMALTSWVESRPPGLGSMRPDGTGGVGEPRNG